LAAHCCGQVKRWLAVTFRNITDRKRAEIALRDSEERFRAIFEQAAVGIAKTALCGQFMRVNPGFCQIVRYAESELLQKNWQAITHPDDIEADREYVSSLLSGTFKLFLWKSVWSAKMRQCAGRMLLFRQCAMPRGRRSI
jgi:PAS domain-containing protein